MVRIIVIDKDPKTKEQLREIFKGDENTRLDFFEQLKDALEILNGEPSKREALNKVTTQVSGLKEAIANKEVSHKALKEKIQAETQVVKGLEDAKNTAESHFAEKSKAHQALAQTAGADAQAVAKSKIEKEQAEKLMAEKQKALKAAAEKFNAMEQEEKKLALEVATGKKQLEAAIPALEEAQKKNAPSTDPVKLVLLDTSFVNKPMNEWLLEFKNSITFEANKAVALAMLSHNDTFEFVRKFLVSGVQDFFLKPVSNLLLKQNVGVLTGTNAEKQVFSLKTSANVDLGVSLEIEEISEFDATLTTPGPVQVNSYVTLYGPMFSEQGKQGVFARCLKCDPHPTVSKAFQCRLSFVAMNASANKQLRLWMRQDYIKKKEKQ